MCCEHKQISSAETALARERFSKPNKHRRGDYTSIDLGPGRTERKRQLSSEHKKIVNYWNCLKPQRNENFARERTKKKASTEPRRSFVFMKAKQLAAVSHFCGAILRSIAFSLSRRVWSNILNGSGPNKGPPSCWAASSINLDNGCSPADDERNVCEFQHRPGGVKKQIRRPPLNGSISVMFRSGCTRANLRFPSSADLMHRRSN